MHDRELVRVKYKTLSHEEVHRIRDVSLMILEKIGFEVEEREALGLFKQAGASVNDSRVRLTSSFIEDVVNQARKKILLAGREEKHDVLLEVERVYIGTGGAALSVIDNETGEVRRAHLRDVAQLARLVDGLDNIDFYLVPVYPTELGRDEVDVSTFYNALMNTTKHVQAGVYSIEGIRNVIAMGELIAGGDEALRKRPVISFITSWMISPLKFSTEVTKLLIEICRKGMPVVLSCAPIAGITAPVTIAGMLAQTTAEQLAGLSLAQLVSPGTPVIPGPVQGIADMRTGVYLGGAAEIGLANAAIAQIFHSYGLPVYNSSGMTDSKLPDIQAGAEKAMSLVLDALAGANYIHHAAGLLENMSTVAPEQFVIDNEIIGMALRVLRGLRVTDETLAIDAIERVGPGGNYLTDDHTLKCMRKEFFYPSSIISREGRELWVEAGGEDARQRACRRAIDILTNHRPKPLDARIDSLIRERFKPIVALTERGSG